MRRSIQNIVILLVLSAAGGLLFVVLRSHETGSDDAGPGAAPGRDTEQTPQVYYAIGDSITFGEELGFSVDESGYPVKSEITFRGWPGLLGYLLTRDTGASTLVLNKGHPGDRTAEMREQRLPDLPRTDPDVSSALILLGTNDSNDFRTTPSGEGCIGASCDGTFKEELLGIIDELQGKGYGTIYVATIPPAWGSTAETLYPDPLAHTATRNRQVIEYNRVIRNQILRRPAVLAGPDLYACLLGPGVNRSSLFEDHIHPNSLGYVVLAALWQDAIGARRPDFTGTPCWLPVYTLSLPAVHAHRLKQNLLVAGSRYYTDEEYVLVNVPDELANGIWVLPANSDRDNDDADFLEFDVGTSPVTVYIAYDPAGKPPLSSSHEFSARDLSSALLVSDASVGRFSVVAAADVTGKVSIGGNRSATGAGTHQAYLVIVTPEPQ